MRTIEHGSFLDDEGIELMVKHGTWLVADIYNGDYIEEVGTRDGWPEEILRKNRETTDIQRPTSPRRSRRACASASARTRRLSARRQRTQFPYMVATE